MEWICKRKDQEKEARRELHGTNGSMVTWKRKEGGKHDEKGRREKRGKKGTGERNVKTNVGERNMEMKVRERKGEELGN